VQDVYHALVDDISFGCNIYNSANPEGRLDSHKPLLNTYIMEQGA
jgi:hypothetical protein